jgi:hypothetical protein
MARAAGALGAGHAWRPVQLYVGTEPVLCQALAIAVSPWRKPGGVRACKWCFVRMTDANGTFCVPLDVHATSSTYAYVHANVCHVSMEHCSSKALSAEPPMADFFLRGLAKKAGLAPLGPLLSDRRRHPFFALDAKVAVWAGIGGWMVDGDGLMNYVERAHPPPLLTQMPWCGCERCGQVDGSRGIVRAGAHGARQRLPAKADATGGTASQPCRTGSACARLAHSAPISPHNNTE